MFQFYTFDVVKSNPIHNIKFRIIEISILNARLVTIKSAATQKKWALSQDTIKYASKMVLLIVYSGIPVSETVPKIQCAAVTRKREDTKAAEHLHKT